MLDHVYINMWHELQTEDSAVRLEIRMYNMYNEMQIPQSWHGLSFLLLAQQYARTYSSYHQTTSSVN